MTTSGNDFDAIDEVERIARRIVDVHLAPLVKRLDPYKDRADFFAVHNAVGSCVSLMSCVALLRAERDDREGVTVTEWGCVLPDDDPDYHLPLTHTSGEGNTIVWRGSRDGREARHVASRGVGRRVVSRQRTTFPDVVTDWAPAEPEA